MEEERRVGDDARLGRAREAAGEQLLQVDLLLVVLRHREGDLDPAVLPGNRPLRLALHRHLAARMSFHLRGQRPHVETGGAGHVDVGDTREDVGHEQGEPLGLLHAGLVGLHALLELGLGLDVPLYDRDEAAEQLGLGLLGDVGAGRVERGEGGHGPHEQERVGRQLVGRLPRTPAVEHVGIGVELGVGEPAGLHRGGQAVGVGIGHDDRPLTRELSGLDEATTPRIALPVADHGIAADQLTDVLRGCLDLLGPGVARGGLIVVVAHVHLDTPTEERLDGRGELSGCGGVDEHDPPRPRGDRGQHGLTIGGSKELGHEDGGAGDVKSEHCCLHEVGPGCHPTFRIDGTISLLGFPLASLVWKVF